MDSDAGRKITQWLGAGPGALQTLAQLLEEHQQIQRRAEAAVEECARLRQELAAVRAENRHLVEAWSEMDEAVADGLGKANDAMLRLRAALTAPVPTAPPAERDADEAPSDAAPHESPAAAVAPPPPAPQHASAAGETNGSTRHVTRILVVDDDPNFRAIMVDYLTHKRGYEVDTATSGDEAMAALAINQTDVVLLDLAMPGGGLWAIERIKACHPELAVIVVSANDDMSIVAKAHTVGASDYVAKPFDLEYLGELLDNHFASKEAMSLSFMATELSGNGNGGAAGPTH